MLKKKTRNYEEGPIPAKSEDQLTDNETKMTTNMYN